MVLLLDVDNTLLDNDRVTNDLHEYLEREVGDVLLPDNDAAEAVAFGAYGADRGAGAERAGGRQPRADAGVDLASSELGSVLKWCIVGSPLRAT